MTPLLSVTGLVKTFGGTGSIFGARHSSVRAVDGVSFSIQAGETLGLVGETGSGKSTVGRLVLKLLEPTGGRILFDGEDVTDWRGAQARRLRNRMQMVFQDPYGSLDPRMRIGELVREPMVVHGYSRDAIQTRSIATMREVGLDPAMASRYPHEFSGGQRQRIAIARALVLDPKLLVLDEPVSALDVSIQAQILNLLRDIQKRTGIAYLFIAHDLAVVRHISDRVAVMYLGRLAEIGVRDALYGQPAHPYTQALLSAVAVPDPVKERATRRIALHGEIGSAASMPAGCRFHPRCFLAREIAAGKAGVAGKLTDAGVGGEVNGEVNGAEIAPRCANEIPELREIGQHHQVACHHSS